MLPYTICQEHQSYINPLVQQIPDLRNKSGLIKYLNTYLGQSQVLGCGQFEKGPSFNIFQTSASHFPSPPAPRKCDSVLGYLWLPQIVVFGVPGVLYGGANDAAKHRKSITQEIHLQQSISCVKAENIGFFSSLKWVSYQVQVHLIVQFTKVFYISSTPSPTSVSSSFHNQLHFYFIFTVSPNTVRAAVQSLKTLVKFLIIKIQVNTSRVHSHLCFLS